MSCSHALLLIGSLESSKIHKWLMQFYLVTRVIYDFALKGQTSSRRVRGGPPNFSRQPTVLLIVGRAQSLAMARHVAC